jgi:hypothetical protein
LLPVTIGVTVSGTVGTSNAVEADFFGDPNNRANIPTLLFFSASAAAASASATPVIKELS